MSRENFTIVKSVSQDTVSPSNFKIESYKIKSNLSKDETKDLKKFE